MKLVRTIIFAKAPQPGFAKTRLIPALGQKGAADLARQMLCRTLQAAMAASIGPVEMCVTPALSEATWQGIALPSGVEITHQGAGDLGARMARAAQQGIERGQSVLLIGTDCVEMSAALLREAAQALLDHDAVIHGTTDGGYALLGIRQFNPILFAGMPWSTDQVANITIARLGQLGWSVHMGQRLHDVDEPQDLKHLPDLSSNAAQMDGHKSD